LHHLKEIQRFLIIICGSLAAASQALSALALGSEAAVVPELSEVSQSAVNLQKSVSQPAEAIFDHSYQLFADQLVKYLENGEVHYKRWQGDQAGLNQFLAELSALSPEQYQHFSVDQKKAFWINAFNALTIKVVLDNYPIKGNQSQYPPSSFRQIPGEWENGKFKIMGKPINLYDIEHERLRHDFPDPRVHFAVVPAARSCARLSPRPFVAAGLDQRLDQCTREFFADPNNLTVNPDNGIMRVNKIFSWFTLDFASKAGYAKRTFPPPMDQDIIASYVSFYVPTEERDVIDKFRKQDKLVLDYLPYDWALNDADEIKAAR